SCLCSRDLVVVGLLLIFFFSSRRRHTRFSRDWSSDVCSSDLWLEVWTTRQAPPNFHGKPLKLLYASQVAVAPPTFVFSINSESFLTRPYEHYLRNRIREDLGFAEVPIRMVFKERQGGKKKVRT